MINKQWTKWATQDFVVKRFEKMLVHILTHQNYTCITPGDKKNGILALFSHKMAFLKSKFKDDPVRVQRHTVRHFKDLE